MNYSDKPSMVRVDFFKPSGKWYTTEAVNWESWYNEPIIYDAFKAVLASHLRIPGGGYRLRNMIAVCLEPYHRNALPLMMDTNNALGSGPEL